MKNLSSALASILIILTSITAAAKKSNQQPVGFSQQVSPNTDGQVEGATSLRFNWGLFCSEFIYTAETITENYTDNTQDTFVSQNTRTFNLIALKLNRNVLAVKRLSLYPAIGAKLSIRDEKKIGENLTTGSEYWFTEESRDRFLNCYGAGTIRFTSSGYKLDLTAGGGYIFKKTDGDFRNSAPDADLHYTSSDRGFNFFADLKTDIRISPRFTLAIAFSYYREVSYYERFYIAAAARENYAYSINQYTCSIRVYFDFLKDILKGTPFAGITCVDYHRSIETGSREKLHDFRLKFDTGVKL